MFLNVLTFSFYEFYCGYLQTLEKKSYMSIVLLGQDTCEFETCFMQVCRYPTT